MGNIKKYCIMQASELSQIARYHCGAINLQVLIWNMIIYSVSYKIQNCRESSFFY